MIRFRSYAALGRARQAAVAVLVAAALLLQGSPLSHAALSGTESSVSERVAAAAEGAPPCHDAGKETTKVPARSTGDETASLCCASMICGMVVQALPPEPATVVARSCAGFILPAKLSGPAASAPSPRWRPPAIQL